MTERATVFALTPVLDEAWILDAFVACASTWADHVIIADQGSVDGSRDIAARYPKVTLVENKGREYDEAARQRLLIETARAIPVGGRRVLIALDADEFLTSNWSESEEWDAVLSAEPGTVLWFDWLNIAPGGETAWKDTGKVPFGFVDDGREHSGGRIHSRRIPVPEGAPALELDAVKVLHLQYVDWARMRSKQRWYQCWERVNFPEKSAVTLYRQYHHMDAGVQRAETVDPNWTASYRAMGIDLAGLKSSPPHRWDAEILELFDQFGTDRFRRIDVWDVDWSAINFNLARPGPPIRDPRTWLDRVVLRWLKLTQVSADRVHVRVGQRLLRLLGW